jgi:hypothetical protein
MTVAEHALSATSQGEEPEHAHDREQRGDAARAEAAQTQVDEQWIHGENDDGERRDRGGG